MPDGNICPFSRSVTDPTCDRVNCELWLGDWEMCVLEVIARTLAQIARSFA